MSANELKSLWKHLRIPFQLTLSPLFLLGWTLAGGARDLEAVAPAFIAFHMLLYPGITAFNSWFDRDCGPIGGLEHPPQVPRLLLPASLLLQVGGIIVALVLGEALSRIYLILMVLSVLYSHPRTRWKANPWLSLLIVVGGQGGLGYIAGWAAARGGMLVAMPGAEGWLGGGICMAATLGMYPLTQLFQTEEDLARGDRTLCVALGPNRALTISQAAYLVAGILAVTLAVQHEAPVDATIATIGFGVMISCVEALKRRLPSLSRAAVFHFVLRLSYASAAAFTLFILLRITQWIH